MRRLAIFVLALAFGAPACDDDNPVGPSNSGPIVFTAELRASNEVPAIAGAEANGQGRVTITFNVPRDASGNITGDGTWNVQAVLSGLTDATHDPGGAHSQRRGRSKRWRVHRYDADPSQRDSHAGRICHDQFRGSLSPRQLVPRPSSTTPPATISTCTRILNPAASSAAS